MAGVIGDIFSLNDVYERQTLTVDSAVVEVQAMTGLTVTATSGTGSVATLTFATQTVAPFSVGSVIAVFGVVPVAYTGTYRVTACTTTTVSYDSTATGTITTNGTVLLVTETTVQSNFWSDLRSHGWFGGGYAPASSRTTVDRIDFSNDSSTASVRGPLSLARTQIAATGNSNYGWFGGGQLTVSTVDRIDFSNDSATASVRGPLSFARWGANSTGNSNYGWFGGGRNSPLSLTLETVDRIDFSNDSSTASVRGPLSLARYILAATGNSNYGWFGGGYNAPNSRSTVDRIDFSNDSSTVSVRGPLSLSRNSLAATGNTNYGWFGAGSDTPTYSIIDRIDFSNDSSTASVRGPLSSARYGLGATGNSNYGWFGGGSPGPVSTVARIDFSNDSSTASVRGPLSLGRGRSMGATSGQAKSSSIKLQKGGNFGWVGGGNFPSVSTVDRIDFSNDSVTASVRGSLIAPRARGAATGNSNYGWFGGGLTLSVPTPGVPAGRSSSIERIDFSNDSSTTSLRGPLSGAMGYFAATGNSNYGWFGGGYVTIAPVAARSRVDRINFSNDSSTASVRGPLSLARQELAATGNSNYGWFGGGVPGPGVIVNRIDFSNDSSTTSVRGPLSLARFGLAATGNSNYGWFGGGSTAGSITTVDRIDFSNDSSRASVRGPLNARNNLAATGNSNYGWFGGGAAVPGPVATVDRIDFSNDSSTASVRGPLSSARYRGAATSNATR